VVNDTAAGNAGGIGNYYDSANAYPNVAAIVGTGGSAYCTGSLINSRTVLTAAHCFFTNNVFDGTAGQSVSFKPVASNDPAVDPNTRGITSMKINGTYVSGSTTFTGDIAVISLAAPITALTPVTLLTASPGSSGFPQVGAAVSSVGYGQAGSGSADPATYISDGKRRVVTSTLGGYLIERSVTDTATYQGATTICSSGGTACLYGGNTANGTQSYFYAQFRNPASPNSPNYFGLTQTPGTNEGGPGKGDSGGPLFTTINGQLVQIGELGGGCVPGGANCNSSGYGAVNQWTPLNLYSDWLAQNNPLRLVTAAAGNFNWSNAAAWVDSVPGVAAASPDNTVGNVANFATDVARYYQVTLSNAGTITLDTNPSVDTVAISGGQSQLLLPTGFLLTAVTSTTVSAGSLTLSGGGLATPTINLTGGFIQGNGTLTGTTDSANVTTFTNNGGTLAPLGTLVVQGTFTQTAGGTTQFRASNTGTTDLLNVSGAANLGGTIKAAVQPGLFGATTDYSIVVAATTLNGTFANAASSSPFFKATATNNGNNVDVTLTRQAFGSIAGLNANQQAVGNVLERNYSTGLTGNIGSFYSNILSATSTDALTQLSGANTAVTQTLNLSSGSMFMTMMLDQGGAWLGGDTGTGTASSGAPLGYAVADKPTRGSDAFAAMTPRQTPAPRTWRAWTSAFGAIQGLTTSDGTSANQQVGGGAIGADLQVDPTRLFGFTFGASTSGFSAGSTSGTATAGHIGLYGVQTFSPFYVAGALTYSRANNATNRTITGVGPTENAKGSFASDQLGGRVELGRRFLVSSYGVTPYVALQYSTVWQRGYTENSTTASGAPGVLGLTYQPTTTTSLPGFLGVQLDQRMMLGNKLWTPYLRASWVHEFKPASQITAGFVTVPGSQFTVDGPRTAADSARIEVGSKLALTARMELFGKFTGEFSGSSYIVAGNGGIKMAW